MAAAGRKRRRPARAPDLVAPHKAGRRPAEPPGGRAGPARPRPAAQASRLGRAGGTGADAAKPRRAEPCGRAAIPQGRREGCAGPFPELRPWKGARGPPAAAVRRLGASFASVGAPPSRPARSPGFKARLASYRCSVPVAARPLPRPVSMLAGFSYVSFCCLPSKMKRVAASRFTARPVVLPALFSGLLLVLLAENAAVFIIRACCGLLVLPNFS